MATGNDRPRFAVYFDGRSYYSHKVLLAFFVKGETFIEKYVDFGRNEQYERWYMLKNPAGALPLLECGDYVISESNDIIDFLDKNVPRAPRLVPDLSTDIGQEVARFRKLLLVNVTVIRFGLAYHPSLAPSKYKGKSKLELVRETQERVATLERLASENPDLKDAYLAKIPPILKMRRDDCSDVDTVKKEMDYLQATLDEVEKRIAKTGEGTSGETWMFGKDFTAADISLSVLLRRLSAMDLTSICFTSTKRPMLYKYWRRLQTYPAYCKLEDIYVKYTQK